MTRTRTRGQAAAAALVLATVLAACAGGPADGPATPTATGDTSLDATSGDDPTTDVPFAAGGSPVTADPSADAALVVTDVRVSRHDGFDRVVLDLEGEGAPGWDVGYEDAPADDGSGEPVRVDGDGVLRVRLSGMAMPGEDPDVTEYDGATIDPEGTEAVEEVVYRFWFEGYTTAYVGVDEPGLPFRVFALEDPARVVVDVQDPTDD